VEDSPGMESTAATLPRVRTFPAGFAALTDVRHFVTVCAEEMPIPPDVVDDLLVAVTETCRDMLSHELSTVLVVSCWAKDGSVEILVKDEGATSEPGPVVHLEEGEESFGFPYILAFVDEMEIRTGTVEEPGTTVRLVKETSRP
jgi:anti-sigma regulatory factor (Ser/Thr protein kinase)